MSSLTCAGVDRRARRPFRIVPVGVLILSLGTATRTQADDAKPGGMGKLESTTGTLLRREGADKEWKAVANGAAVPDGELLLALPGVQAAIKSNSGGARLTLWGNVPQISLTPALESAVTLRRSSDYDLDLILDRGRILVTNLKENGSANVRVRARDEIWELSLKEPGAAVSIELNGRWPAGVPYKPQAREGEGPEAEMVLLVLKGTAELKVDDENRTLRAPPGPALFHWHSLTGLARTPQGLDKLPAWAEPGADSAPPAAGIHEATKPLVASLATKPAGAALADLLASADTAASKEKGELLRELAVTGFGAIDDLPHLFKALGSEKDAVERLIAVETLRHWIGRKPGQDAALGRYLVREDKYSPEHAAAALQLLHSYGQKAIEDPVTYEVLIAYLQHDKLPMRELAAWHLYRLAPAGRDIRYDPAAAKEKREEAVKAWKKLVPSGELPPTPKRN